MTKDRRASEDALADLHAELAKELKNILKNGEEQTEDGKKVVKASTLNVIRQFLKDNDITAINRPGSPLGDLTEALPEDFGLEDDDEFVSHQQH